MVRVKDRQGLQGWLGRNHQGSAIDQEVELFGGGEGGGGGGGEGDGFSGSNHSDCLAPLSLSVSPPPPHTPTDSCQLEKSVRGGRT